MTREVLQNTARKFMVYMVDDADLVTPETALVQGDFTVTLSKSGVAQSTVSPTITPRGNGWYEVTPLAAHRDTLGESAWTFQAAGAVDYPRLEEVVATDNQVAIQDAINSSLVVPSEYQLPVSGTVRFRIDLRINASNTNSLADPDSNTVNISVRNTAGALRDDFWDDGTGGMPTAVMIRDGVGLYHVFYAVASTDAKEQLLFTVAYNEGGNPMTDGETTMIVAVSSGGGGTMEIDSFSAAALAQLSAIEIALASPYSSKTKTLTLVQNKDYTAGSLVGLLRFKITDAGAADGDVVRFGAVMNDGTTIESTGAIADDAGTLYAEIPLTKETHTNRTPTELGKYELEHISAGGDVSPLISDHKLILLSAHPE